MTSDIPPSVRHQQLFNNSNQNNPSPALFEPYVKTEIGTRTNDAVLSGFDILMQATQSLGYLETAGAASGRMPEPEPQPQQRMANAAAFSPSTLSGLVSQAGVGCAESTPSEVASLASIAAQNLFLPSQRMDASSVADLADNATKSTAKVDSGPVALDASPTLPARLLLSRQLAFDAASVDSNSTESTLVEPGFHHKYHPTLPTPEQDLTYYQSLSQGSNSSFASYSQSTLSGEAPDAKLALAKYAAGLPVVAKTFGPGQRDRTCATCQAQYSSGNWYASGADVRYKDKSRPGQYMCKSCYVCLNRKRGGVAKSGADGHAPVRQRRRPVVREEFHDRVCIGCASNHSSGDW
ncbi:hypothetical protein HDU91_004765 [Kappamyces sp. JEL0680]|nr:hypothetical protein HDU91_004765 [Kappamyces sp. JEL0680]